jgi:hypothetical protein
MTPSSEFPTAPDAAGATPTADLIFLTRGVTPVEAAAVSAVLQGLLREETDSLRAAPTGVQSAWQAGQRAIRPDFVSGRGRWNGFRA